MHYYSHNIGDYRRDTNHLTLLEHGAYRQLLDTYYLTEKPLALNHADLMRTHCARSADEVQAVENVLRDFFVETEEGYIHKRCDIEIEAFHAKSTSARESAKARWDRVRAEKDADAMRTHSEGNANHKPITKNQEPEDKSSCDQQAESPKADRIDYGSVTSSFSEHLGALPQPRDMTEKRRKMVRSIVKRGGRYAEPEFFAKFFAYVAKSDFLMGRGAKPWHGCCFDWLLKPENFQKIIEGNYHGEGNNA